ncbi:Ig-like domain repeat protein, partial [Silvibacterium sp.]|uniref:NHL domain-containing protein n=1 Tax=Silvibacterium sp. TaxID=1964179 RepID=UPI0039E2BCEF
MQVARFAALLVVLTGCALSSEAQNSFTFSNAQNVGTPSTIQLLMTATVAGTVHSVKVLTMGQPNLDFTSGGDSCISTLITPKNTCTVSVIFDPKYPGVRNGAVVLLDSSNNVLGITYLSGTGAGALGVMVPGTITTVAGSGEWTGLGDGDPATSGDLNLPAGVVVDGAGDLFIADSAHNRIREVFATGTNAGEITTICNTTGQPAYSGDGGAAIDATLSNPQGIAIDGAGNLFIADTGNNAIRRIDAFTGVITSVVNQQPASSSTSSAGFSGDGGAATSALLDTPYGVTVAPNGDLYIADTKNQRIRKVTATTQDITTVAGNGTTVSPGVGSYSGDGGTAVLAELNAPYAVTLDSAGNLYIADTGNNRVRVVYASGTYAGTIATYAGNGSAGYNGDSGLATSASFYAPSGLVFDVAGNLYVADTQNNRVRKISTGGIVTTIAGNGTGKYEGDGGIATSAGLYGPQGLFLDALGNLYIADYFDHRIREVQSNLAILTFTPEIREDQVTSPQLQTIENDGNAKLSFTGIAPDSNAAVDASSTTCSISTSLLSDASCIVGAEFAPTQVGNPVVGNISLTGNPANAPLDIEVEGESDELTSTTTTLSATPNPALYGASVVLSATVTTGTGTLSGSVTFMDGSATIGKATLASSGLSGTATLSTTALTVGAHQLTAIYNSDGVHGTSTSAEFTETIQQSTTTVLASSENPSVSGDSVIFTATVTSFN